MLEHIAEPTYSDNLHKILQQLLPKVKNDHQPSPACCLPPTIFSKQGYDVGFLGDFLQSPGRQSTEPQMHKTPNAQNPISYWPQAHMYLVSHQENYTEKLVCFSFACQNCASVPSHEIPT